MTRHLAGYGPVADIPSLAHPHVMSNLRKPHTIRKHGTTQTPPQGRREPTKSGGDLGPPTPVTFSTDRLVLPRLGSTTVSPPEALTTWPASCATRGYLDGGRPCTTAP